MKKLITLTAILAAAATSAMAQPTHHHAAAKSHMASKHAALICPVTGTKIASVAAAIGHTTYKGKTYYFCCPECKPRFDKNPQHFVDDSKHGKYEKM